MNRLELTSTTIHDQAIEYRYSFEGKEYATSLEFGTAIDASRPAVQRLIEYAAIVSCYHLFDLAYFDEIAVPFGLHPEEKAFFEALYFNGLAEFRLRNKLDLTRATRIIASGEAPAWPAPNHTAAPLRPLLLNGGGKDGAVAAEILKATGTPFAWYTYQPRPSRGRVVEASGVTGTFYTRKLNNPPKKEFKTYHGHKPLSGQLAVYASLAALLTGRNSVVCANEYSSNFANLVQDGVVVNHQFTKSFDFEQSFAHIVHQFVDQSLHYFSIVRPLYDIQILSMFAHLDHYFPVFLSCNKSMRKDKWCLRCPKCAFVALGMLAFRPDASQTIWHKPNPLVRPELFKELVALIDESPKPFDCVGTPEEVAYGLLVCQKNGSFNDFSLEQRATLQEYLVHYDFAALGQTLMTTEGRAHQIPQALWDQMAKLPFVQKAST